MSMQVDIGAVEYNGTEYCQRKPGPTAQEEPPLPEDRDRLDYHLIFHLVDLLLLHPTRPPTDCHGRV